MNLQDFKDIHQNKSAAEKLSLLIDTMDMIGSCRVNYSTISDLKSRAHYRIEIEGQKARVEWLYNEIKAALAAQDADSNAKAAESVAIAANAVVSGKSDKMYVE